MNDLEFLSALVKSLTRDVEEQREAVGLLLSLCDDAGIRRRIGRIQGCILMLVAISNGDNQEASHDAKMLLNAMSGNTQHALHMAEAGYFKPLINYLKDGNFFFCSLRTLRNSVFYAETNSFSRISRFRNE